MNTNLADTMQVLYIPSVHSKNYLTSVYGIKHFENKNCCVFIFDSQYLLFKRWKYNN